MLTTERLLTMGKGSLFKSDKDFAIENINNREDKILKRLESYYTKKNFNEEKKLDSDYILKGIKSELFKEYVNATEKNQKNVWKYFFEDKEETDVFYRKVDVAIERLYMLFDQVQMFYSKGDRYKTQLKGAQESVDKIYNCYEENFERKTRGRSK